MTFNVHTKNFKSIGSFFEVTTCGQRLMVDPDINLESIIRHMREPMVTGKATDLVFNRFPPLVFGKISKLLWYLSHSTAISDILGDSINRLYPPDLAI